MSKIDVVRAAMVTASDSERCALPAYAAHMTATLTE